MNVVVSDGVLLAYRVDGSDDAPTLAMVNSLGTDLRMWDPQLALLTRSLRVVHYDCRGHGACDVPPDLTLSNNYSTSCENDRQ